MPNIQDNPYSLRPAVECTPRGGLPNLFARLRAGQPVSVAYLGGSITAQAGWRVYSLQWLRRAWPDAEITEVNAAISGTGSGLGAFRLQHDVLQHKPDLLFIEFAVNDSGYPQQVAVRGMEGIVRQARRVLPELDICFVYTLAFESMLHELQAGRYPPTASAMEAVADHYALPSIHLGLEIARLEAAGRLVFQGTLPATDAGRAALGDRMLFSEDGVHPLVETGHVVYGEVLARSLERIAETPGVQPGPRLLPAPLAADNMEHARMLPLAQAGLSAGWRRLDPAANALIQRFGGFMPELWVGGKGESLSFRFRGTTAWLYDLVGPDCGALRVKVDDQPEQTRLRFDAWCEDHRICWLEAASGLPEGEHTVTITVDGQMPDKRGILFERSRADYDANPAKYAPTNWYAGSLLLIGELL